MGRRIYVVVIIGANTTTSNYLLLRKEFVCVCLLVVIKRITAKERERERETEKFGCLATLNSERYARKRVFKVNFLLVNLIWKNSMLELNLIAS